ncbi:hypothetical protein MGYG_05181 [Nannizzia gypsea CBS 118893]|uniref:Uncharacterized protein n=1 Tax=Arthroderma gypseum (strain ATCC MYA-4604 / CBS 118893) TaxID=535722 RepID=E4UYL5_ARTGP|nr:hypothetical protein MGYG_05181 [Nannizzia gypsea CBS 118893]EFR02178.1 hypothetical protein MGYG_05181 [Nannizzia gypsea CBS 118893]
MQCNINRRDTRTDTVKQASAAGLRPKADFFLTLRSEQIRATLERDQTLSTFSSAGGSLCKCMPPVYRAMEANRLH